MKGQIFIRESRNTNTLVLSYRNMQDVEKKRKAATDPLLGHNTSTLAPEGK